MLDGSVVAELVGVSDDALSGDSSSQLSRGVASSEAIAFSNTSVTNEECLFCQQMQTS